MRMRSASSLRLDYHVLSPSVARFTGCVGFLKMKSISCVDVVYMGDQVPNIRFWTDSGEGQLR